VIATDPAAWPNCLHGVIARRGISWVWVVGLRVLGFPPTWAGTGKDVMAILSQE